MFQPLGGIEKAIQDSLGDPRSRFVFPSALSAEFWARESLRIEASPAEARPKPQAVSGTRFISWDSFKARVFSTRAEGLLPASARLRSVFAADLLSRNAEAPFLRVLIPPEHVSDWEGFVAPLARALPRLDSLRLRLEEGKAGLPPSAELRDWMELRSRWAAFMADKKRFEPAWEGRAYAPDGSSWTIFLPELLEDWEDYQGLLPRDGSLRVIGLEEAGLDADAPPAVNVFEGLLEEIRWSLGKAAGAWAGGQGGRDAVVLTVAGLDRLRPWLEREAALFGLPLDLRQGGPLADWPAGRIFTLMGAAAGGGWAFDTLRDILLAACLPWKDRGSCAALVRFGLSACVLEGWKDEGGAPVDPWEYAFGGGKGAALRPFYRKLKASLKAMVDASSFKDIRIGWMRFREDFLDKEAFDPESDKIFARCVAILDELVQAQADAALRSVPGAYRLFLDALSSERYVPRGGRGGIPVYDWRVSAGIRPGLHLLLNAGQAAASVPTGGLPFLREDLRRSLGLAEGDASEAFIRAYAASGLQVSFSCSRAGIEGAQVPHGAFRALGASGLDDGECLRRDRDDALSRERLAWAGRGPFPEALPASVLRGFAAASDSCLAERGADYADREGREPSAAAMAAVRAILVQRSRSLLEREGGAQTGVPDGGSTAPPALSVSLLDDWLACRWRALFGSVLRAREDRHGLEAFDPNFRGIFLHRALAALYASIRALGPFSAARLEEYQGLIPEAIDRAVAETQEESGRFAGIALESERAWARALMLDVLGQDAVFFEGAEVEGLEEGLVLRGQDWILEGRIDRLMRLKGADWVIDYKSGRSPLEKNMVLPPAEAWPPLAETQLTGYLELLEGLGRKAGGGLYYSGADRAYHALCGIQGAALDGEDLAEARGRFRSLLDGLAEGLGSGPFPLAPPEGRKDVCGPCPLKAACRVFFKAG